jgi:hypothetical protein
MPRGFRAIYRYSRELDGVARADRSLPAARGRYSRVGSRTKGFSEGFAH